MSMSLRIRQNNRIYGHLSSKSNDDDLKHAKWSRGCAQEGSSSKILIGNELGISERVEHSTITCPVSKFIRRCQEKEAAGD